MSLAIYTDRSLDLSDGDLVAAIFEVIEQVKDLGPVRVQVRRLGVPTVFNEAARESVDTALFAAADDLRDLRTIDSLEALFGEPEGNLVVKYSRDSSPPARSAIAVEPRRLQELVKFRDGAQARATEARKAAQTSNGSTAKNNEANAADAAYAAAAKAVADVEKHAPAQMLACIRACHRAGLIRPFREVPVDLGSGRTPDANRSEPAVAGEIAALRATIVGQQRVAAETEQRLADEYHRRSEALRVEADERAARVHAEFAAREQRVLAEIQAREDAIAAQAEELGAREARLELNDEKAERRRLRRELQEATKQRAEKPDLSKDARDSFDRVLKATGWTVVLSVIVLGLSVGVPFFALGERATEITWLSWSLRALAGLTFGPALIYYVRTLARRAQLIADTEVRSRQFAFDVDRAQWLVEMALEHDKSSKPLSPELIAAFSRGLFETDARSESDTPSSLTNLLVNADGVEVSLSKRGVRRALRGASLSADPGSPG